MGAQEFEQALVAIRLADVAGYPLLNAPDEEGTLARLKAQRRALSERTIYEHRGHIVRAKGDDGFLVLFDSVVDAVRCAVEIQRAMDHRKADVPEERPIQFRIGINVGRPLIDGANIFGDAVNITDRLEELAEPGRICVSAVVWEQVRDWEQVHNKLPYAWEDMGEQQVKNRDQQVRVFRVVHENPVPDPPPHPGKGRGVRVGDERRVLPDRPSLAILPFKNLTGNAKQEYFVDGIVEELITEISRFPWLFVIARNSSFIYKGQAVNVKRVSRELGVRYVLEGSVREEVDKVCITVQLIDASNAQTLWAESYEREKRHNGILALQRRLAANVAAAIKPELEQTHIEWAARRPTQNLDAYYFYLRALAEFHGLSLVNNLAAIKLLRQALHIDGSYAPAAGLVGWCRVIQMLQGWAMVSPEERGEAVHLAEIAIVEGQEDPDALWMAGITLLAFTAEIDVCMPPIERALTLNPNSAYAWAANGWAQSVINQPAPAITAFERAMRLSPHDPLRYIFTSGLALAQIGAGRFHDAMKSVDQSLSARPGFFPSLRYKVALCGLLDRPEAEGLRCRQRLLEVRPNYTIAKYRAEIEPYFAPKLGDLIAKGLQTAGLPSV